MVFEQKKNIKKTTNFINTVVFGKTIVFEKKYMQQIHEVKKL